MEILHAGTEVLTLETEIDETIEQVDKRLHAGDTKNQDGQTGMGLNGGKYYDDVEDAPGTLPKLTPKSLLISTLHPLHDRQRQICQKAQEIDSDHQTAFWD